MSWRLRFAQAGKKYDYQFVKESYRTCASVQRSHIPAYKMQIEGNYVGIATCGGEE